MGLFASTARDIGIFTAKLAIRRIHKPQHKLCILSLVAKAKPQIESETRDYVFAAFNSLCFSNPHKDLGYSPAHYFYLDLHICQL